MATFSSPTASESKVTYRVETTWSFTPQDVPGDRFDSLQQAWRLPNGNTVIDNWVNE
jgi:hypothetical protein